MNFPKLVSAFLITVVFLFLQPVMAADFKPDGDFDFSDDASDHDHSVEDRRRERLRKSVEDEQIERDEADAARAQSKMRAKLEDDKLGALGRVKSTLFDGKEDRYAVDLSSDIRHGGGVIRRGLPKASLKDISDVSDEAVDDDSQKQIADMLTSHKADSMHVEPRSVYMLINRDDDSGSDSDDPSHANEWHSLIKPKDLIGDWVPSKVDREDNGGFVTEDDLGHPVPYTLNGHIRIQRPLPWEADK